MAGAGSVNVNDTWHWYGPWMATTSAYIQFTSTGLDFYDKSKISDLEVVATYTYTGEGTLIGFATTSGGPVVYTNGDTQLAGNTTWNLYTVTATQSDAYEFTEGNITSVANAIRSKHQGWSSKTILYPNEFVSGITSLAVGSIEETKTVSYNTPGSIRITPSSGYVGFEALSAGFYPNVWDGQNTWTPAPVLITFTVQDDQIGGTYTAESGMTWGDWVNTAYNTVNFINDNGSIKQNGGQVIARDMNIHGTVMATDEIQEAVYAVIRLTL